MGVQVPSQQSGFARKRFDFFLLHIALGPPPNMWFRDHIAERDASTAQLRNYSDILLLRGGTPHSSVT